MSPEGPVNGRCRLAVCMPARSLPHPIRVPTGANDSAAERVANRRGGFPVAGGGVDHTIQRVTEITSGGLRAARWRSAVGIGTA